MIQRASCVILAGGESKRPGYDKTLLLVEGTPLLSYVAHQLSLCFDEIIISSRKPRAVFQHREVLDIPYVPGPMGGLITALSQAKEEWVFITACDMPFVSESYINLLASKRKPNIDVVIAHVNDRLQPMAAFYHRSVYAHFYQAAKEGELSLIKTLQKLRLSIVQEEVLAKKKMMNNVFFDIDTPEDFERAVKIFSRHGKKLTMTDDR